MNDSSVKFPNIHYLVYLQKFTFKNCQGFALFDYLLSHAVSTKATSLLCCKQIIGVEISISLSSVWHKQIGDNLKKPRRDP